MNKKEITNTLHHYKEENLPFGTVIPPIFQTSIFSFKSFEDFAKALNYKGYCYDITRTFVVGQATAKQKDIYYTVKKAQQKGLDLLKVGVKGKNVCAEARKIIEDAGYGDYTGYGLGHGVGLEVHEDPYFRSYGELVFEEGHVVTVEPGIYIPGWGGVRIEDTVVIEKMVVKFLRICLKI